jgi:hypothetical protein
MSDFIKIMSSLITIVFWNILNISHENNPILESNYTNKYIYAPLLIIPLLTP